MMKMKKIGLLSSTLALSLFLFGCSQSEGGESTGGTNSGGSSNSNSYDLYIMQSQGEIADQLEDLVELYEDETGKTVKLVSIRAGEDPMSTLRAEMNKSNKPSLFSVEGQRQLEEWLGGDLVLSLSDWDFTDEIVFGAGGIERDGEIYGIPTSIEGYGYVYDRRMFEALGLTQSDLDFLQTCTYEEFEEFLSALTAFTVGETITGTWSMMNNAEKTGVLANVEACFIFPGMEAWSYGNHLVSIPVLYEFGDQINTLQAQTVDFTYAAQYRGALDQMIRYTPSGFSKELLQTDYTSQVNIGLATGQVFMIMQGNWIYSDVKNVDEEKAENLEFLPIKFPKEMDGVTVSDTFDDSITVFAPRYWSINAQVSTSEQEEAKAFVEWLYTSDTGKEYAINEFNYIPAVTGFEDYDISNALGRSILEYMDAGNTLDAPFMAMPDGWSWHDVGDKLQEKYFETGDSNDFYDVIEYSIGRWADLKK